MNMTAQDAQQALRKVARPDRVESTKRFFKAYPGGYSEGDEFLCCSVPATRLVAKDFYKLPLPELSKLISSRWHDDRLLALIILVRQYEKGSEVGRRAVYDFYIKHLAHVNNWDLVDTSAGQIVGEHLRDRPRDLLEKLAHSDNLWERRVSMVSTFQFLKNGDPTTTLLIAEILLHDSHDLIQKAVGWMLREMGKRVDRAVLLEFLDQHAHEMPRTMLRYSIEHLPPVQRTRYMALKPKV
jgi:3-methyladenine DNA glycosylase AlkD